MDLFKKIPLNPPLLKGEIRYEEGLRASQNDRNKDLIHGF